LLPALADLTADVPLGLGTSFLLTSLGAGTSRASLHTSSGIHPTEDLDAVLHNAVVEGLADKSGWGVSRRRGWHGGGGLRSGFGSSRFRGRLRCGRFRCGFSGGGFRGWFGSGGLEGRRSEGGGSHSAPIDDFGVGIESPLTAFASVYDMVDAVVLDKLVAELLVLANLSPAALQLELLRVNTKELVITSGIPVLVKRAEGGDLNDVDSWVLNKTFKLGSVVINSDNDRLDVLSLELISNLGNDGTRLRLTGVCAPVHEGSSFPNFLACRLTVSDDDQQSVPVLSVSWGGFEQVDHLVNCLLRGGVPATLFHFLNSVHDLITWRAQGVLQLPHVVRRIRFRQRKLVNANTIIVLNRVFDQFLDEEKLTGPFRRPNGTTPINQEEHIQRGRSLFGACHTTLSEDGGSDEGK